MSAAIERLPTSQLFMANLSELTQPKAEEPHAPAISLRNAFEAPSLGQKADNLNHAPNALAAAASLAGGASSFSMQQKQGLASGAMLATQSLQSMNGFEVAPQGSDALQLGAHVAKLGMETGKELMKTGGEALQAIANTFSLGDRNADGIPDSQQNLQELEEPKMRPAPISYASMPSPSGMGG